MRLCTYIINHDTGFAPNPFMGCCTLATCKPSIRRNARLGDWIMATGSKPSGLQGRLVYLMRVDEILPIDRYGRDPRFDAKKPKPNGRPEERCGDNIYYRDSAGRWQVRPNRHHDRTDMAKDLRGENVLIGRTFFYFGADAVAVPAEFSQLVRRTQGHRCNFDTPLVERFVRWVSGEFPPGIQGKPAEWRDDGNRLVQLGLPRPRR